MRNLLALGLLLFLVYACGDDDNGGAPSIPPRTLSEQLPEDETAIQEYLATHFYNYEEFETPPADFDFRIRIDTIAGDNADKTPLSQQISQATVLLSSSQLGLSEEEIDVPHTYYYLVAREGAGASPTVADSTLLKYEGRLLDGTPFDATIDFVWQQLPFTIRGYANAFTQFKAGTDAAVIDNPGEIPEIPDSGIGLMVLPSALAYFNNPPNLIIPLYAPLVFTVELGLVVSNTDSDNDGIPNIEEDLNGNNYLFDDNTDADFEADNFQRPSANFVDTDDDGDGIPTREEISDTIGNIVTPFPDSNSDGVPDYLDPDN
ncbi:MAG: hypothetical protein AAGF77_10930 [Bacteroidota bacterium]